MPLAVNCLYEFDKFRLDPSRGVLLQEGVPVSVTTKTLAILLFLIQRRHETVSKDALLKAVWPDTFVEEANLTQHISMLRKALGEAPQDRRYIATVPGTGYRFVAQVREVPEDGSQEHNTAEEMVVIASHSRSEIIVTESTKGGILAQVSAWMSHGNSKTRLLTIAAALALLVLTVGFGRSRFSLGRPLAEKGSILLADFDNSTGEPVFDGALKEGLAAQVGQSPFLELDSTARVRETLGYMGRSPDDRVQLSVALELCQRLGSKAMISGSIKHLGDSYVVAAEALNCADGSVFISEQIQANRREEVLPALGKISSRMRSKLGESLASQQKFDVPLERATTPSLDALKAYSLGMERRTRGAEQDSIPFFEHALALDPSFALAYAQLGAVYRNLGENERANESFKKSYELRSNLSEREKLYVTGRYYEALGDLDNAIKTYEIWSGMYPRDPQPLNILSAFYQVIGQYEMAANASRKALDLDPNRYVTYANLATTNVALNRFDEATIVCRHAADAGKDSVYTHRVLFELAYLKHDEQAMQKEVEWARGSKRENDMLTTEAFALAASGKLSAARILFERSWTSSRNGDLKEDAAFSMAGEALAEADFGNYAQARSRAHAAINLGHGMDAEETTAEALALAGDLVRAQAVLNDLHGRFPKHPALNHASIPTTLAAIQLKRQNPAKALELLQEAEPYDLSEFSGLSPVYIRGLAFLQARRGTEAAGQFQKILDHPGIDPTGQRHALAHLGLARALVLSGDTNGARKAYEDFLAALSGADTEIPIVKTARQEYAKLRPEKLEPSTSLSYVGKTNVEASRANR